MAQFGENYQWETTDCLRNRVLKMCKDYPHTKATPVLISDRVIYLDAPVEGIIENIKLRGNEPDTFESDNQFLADVPDQICRDLGCLTTNSDLRAYHPPKPSRA